MARKTYTSPEVKDRWNRKHYDQLKIYINKGGRDAIKMLAERKGLSVSAYIRHLIIADAQNGGINEISAIIGGGGRDRLRPFQALMSLPEF